MQRTCSAENLASAVHSKALRGIHNGHEDASGRPANKEEVVSTNTT